MAVANSGSPLAVAMFDQASGSLVALSGALPVANAANYTPITTNGTTTVKAGSGVFFGLYGLVLGTAASVAVLDGTATLLGTNTISALNGLISPLPSGLGVRFTNSLVVVTSGTGAASLNVLWD